MSACVLPGKNYRASTRHHWQHKCSLKADFPLQYQSQLSTIVSLSAPRLSLALPQWKSAVAVPAQPESYVYAGNSKIVKAAQDCAPPKKQTKKKNSVCVCVCEKQESSFSKRGRVGAIFILHFLLFLFLILVHPTETF